MRVALPTLLCLLIFATDLPAEEPGAPLRSNSELSLGLSLEHKLFIAIEEDAKGTWTRFNPVAYRAPRWRRHSLRLRSYRINTETPETEATTKLRSERVRTAIDNRLERLGAIQGTPLPGANTGRYRVQGLNMTIYIEEDQVIARTGVLTMKTLVLKDSISRWMGRCRGEQTHRIHSVIAQPEWTAVAVYVESECTPTDEDDPQRRQRRLLVSDVSEIVSSPESP